MSVTYVGSFSLGGALPGVTAAFEAALPDLQARLDALIGFSPSLGSLNANLSLAQNIVSNIQAAINFGITPPDIGAQLAEVEAAVALTEGQLAAAFALLAALDAGGAYLYKYSGTPGNFGSEFDSEIGAGLPGGGGSGASCDGFVILTQTPATWTTIQGLLP